MTKQRLERLAAKLNCTIEFAPMYDIQAPIGKCFASDPGCHYIVFQPWDDQPLAEAYQDAWNRLSAGLTDCSCQQCQEDK
jgi:hypothetical protein